INLSRSYKCKIPVYSINDNSMNWNKIGSNLISFSMTNKIPVIYKSREQNAVMGNNLVMLLKPGVKHPSFIFDKIDTLLRKNGYCIISISVIPSLFVNKYNLIESHLGLQYVNASKSPEKNIISSFSLIEDFGEEEYSKIWREALSSNKKINHYLWLSVFKNLKIANGHIPLIVDVYKNEGNFVVAFHIKQNKRDAKSIKYMKDFFVGSSNPERAPENSLRKMAFDGNLGIQGTVNLQNNAFHLSAGVLEAFRELSIWFGYDYASNILQETSEYLPENPTRFLFDYFPNGESLYEKTSKIDLLDLQFEELK
ncbi:hypothetical protein V7192_19155, partial [Bacillus safensis]